jgi:hypothetical protein
MASLDAWLRSAGWVGEQAIWKRRQETTMISNDFMTMELGKLKLKKINVYALTTAGTSRPGSYIRGDGYIHIRL